MMIARRSVLALGGGALAALAAPKILRAQTVLEITMGGTTRGEHVWFSPMGVAAEPGTLIRFTNRDPGNSHTSTAYAPEFFDRERRIPEGATPWDSDFLLPDESFEVTLTVPGVYDYYCIPHEMAGMVGRIVIGTRETPGWQDAAPITDDLDEEAANAFSSVDDILAKGRIEAEDKA